MLNFEMLDLLGRPGGYAAPFTEGAERPPRLEEVFARVVRHGWAPRNPAFGAELDQLEASMTRGHCLEPLIVEGDVVYVDRNASPQPGDIVSFALSERCAAAQNADLPAFDARPCKAGDRWLKLYAPYCGIDFLYERYGHSITATFAACESPDNIPVLHPVRNVRRNGRLLFMPDHHHASQVGVNAATTVVVASISSPVTVPESTSALTNIVTVSVAASPYVAACVLTMTGTLTVTTNSASGTAPITTASWAIIDNLGTPLGGGSQTIPSIPAGQSVDFNVVQETTITIAANTAKTFTMAVLWGGTGTYTGGQMTAATIKSEVIKR
jgi:hypothetical protein